MPSFCLTRLGAPHQGHAALVKVMLERDAGQCLVLVGSSDVQDRPDTPLPWTQRRDLLLSLLGAVPPRLLVAPLPELRTNGWDSAWCAYLLGNVRRILEIDPSRYVCGDDHPLATFSALRAAAPALELVRVPRRYGKSARELRATIVDGNEALVQKYAIELKLYSAEARAHIARICANGVDRPPS